MSSFLNEMGIPGPRIASMYGGNDDAYKTPGRRSDTVSLLGFGFNVVNNEDVFKAGAYKDRYFLSNEHNFYLDKDETTVCKYPTLTGVRKS